MSREGALALRKAARGASQAAPDTPAGACAPTGRRQARLAYMAGTAALAVQSTTAHGSRAAPRCCVKAARSRGTPCSPPTHCSATARSRGTPCPPACFCSVRCPICCLCRLQARARAPQVRQRRAGTGAGQRYPGGEVGLPGAQVQRRAKEHGARVGNGRDAHLDAEAAAQRAGLPTGVRVGERQLRAMQAAECGAGVQWPGG